MGRGDKPQCEGIKVYMRPPFLAPCDRTAEIGDYCVNHAKVGPAQDRLRDALREDWPSILAGEIAEDVEDTESGDENVAERLWADAFPDVPWSPSP